MRLLVVEDDDLQAQSIYQLLRQRGYVVDLAAEGQIALDFVDALTYDLILLDINLPDFDGIQLCRNLRQRGNNTPVLILTANEAHDIKIWGLDAGADDFLLKPYDQTELFARIRALLRRPNQTLGTSQLNWGPLTIDCQMQQVQLSETVIPLSPKEYHFVELFLRNAGRILSAEVILEHLWGFEDPPGATSIRSHIKRLRRKLTQAGVPDMIETVYGMGYRLRPAPEPEPRVEQFTHDPLQQLWQKSYPQLLYRLDKMRQLVRTAVEQPVTRTDSAAGLAHKLAGSLGVFGLTSGYHQAKKLEEQLSMPSNQWQTRELLRAIAQLQSFVEQAQPNVTPDYSEAVVPAIEPVTLSQPMIMVVDDDPILTQYLATEIQKRNLQIQICPSLSTAQDVLAQQLPDLIVLDLDVPGAPNGALTLLEQLHQEHSTVPIVVYSQQDRLSQRSAVLDYSQLFLSKSIPRTELLDIVCDLLQTGSSLPSRLLIVDDDPVVLQHLHAILTAWEINVKTLTDPRQFWEVLETFNPDLLLLDVQMPHYDGLQLCRIVRQAPQWQNLPIVFLSSCDRSNLAYEIYDSGADDYITKPFDVEQLRSRLLNRLKRNQALQNRADTDGLTGLMNRRRATQDLHRSLRLAQREQQTLCFALIDIDYFKIINDRYGHRVGDLALQHLSQLLQQQFRKEDVVARWGGDEFAVGVYGMTPAEAGQRFTRLVNRVSQSPLIIGHQQVLTLTLSVGLAIYPERGRDVGGLYRAADLALHNAKVSGRNQIQVS